MIRPINVLAAGWRPPPPSGVAIGVFDGVHVGHRSVIEKLVARSEVEGLVTGVLTFDPHPVEILAPGRAPLLLTALERRTELLADLGVGWVGVLDLADIRTMPPETFVSEVLVGRARSRIVSAGADFRFGHDRAGDVGVLAKLGEELGFSVEAVELESAGDEPVSSTRIRRLIEIGDVPEAAALLGRWHRVSGVVLHGDARGRTLGYPTANIAPSERLALPADGIYAVRVSGPPPIEDMPAVASIGVRPTFGEGGRRLLEVHVFDVSADLYGAVLDVDFVRRLRGEERFAQVDDLVAQMDVDAAEAREALSP
ncbi:bifunctional riboflavin kinase/FAD synthetase [soil metagenome]